MLCRRTQRVLSTVGPSTWLTDGGDGELRTSVYPSNIAPIATKLRQRAFRTICNFRFFDVENLFSEKNSDFFFGFSLFLADFRGARLFLTSKSSSSRNFASDREISRSVRQLEPIFQVRPLAKYSGSQVLGPTVGFFLLKTQDQNFLWGVRHNFTQTNVGWGSFEVKIFWSQTVLLNIQ